MPTIVELPDKTELEFPDGMDQIAMHRAIVQSFPQFAESTPSESTGVSAPGQTPIGRSFGAAPLIPEAFPTGSLRLSEAQAAKTPELSGAEVEQMLMTPNIQIPNPVPKTWPITRGIVNVAKGIPEFATAPGAPLIATAQTIPGLREAVDAAMGAGMVKQGAQQIGEASVTGDRQQMTEGVLTAALGATTLAAPHVSPILADEIAARRVGKPDLTAVDVAAHPDLSKSLSVPRITEQPQRGGLFNQQALQGARSIQAPVPKGERPVVPETPPESERGLSVIQEIRAKGADTKEKIRSLFPQLSRETAGKLRDQAFPKEKIPDNLSQKEVDRLFLDKLNEQSNAEIESAASENKPSVKAEMADWLKQQLKEREAQGWNPKWPFVPADLLNKSFRELILEDPTLSLDEKRAIMKFGGPEGREELKAYENKPPSVSTGTAPPSEAPVAGEVSAATQTSGVAAPESPPAISQPTTEGQRGQPGVSPKGEAEAGVGGTWDKEGEIRRNKDGYFERVDSKGEVIDTDQRPEPLMGGFSEGAAGYSTRIVQTEPGRFELFSAEPKQGSEPVHELVPYDPNAKPKLALPGTAPSEPSAPQAGAAGKLPMSPDEWLAEAERLKQERGAGGAEPSGESMFDVAKNWVKPQSDVVKGFLGTRMDLYDRWKTAKGAHKKVAKAQLDAADRELEQAKKVHHDAVEQAYNEGKPVPPDVLKDYPDLKNLMPTKALAPTTDKAAAKVEAQVQEVARTEGQRPAKEVKSELVDRLETAAKEAPFNTEDYFDGLYVYEARTLSETTRLTDRPVEGTVPLKVWLDRPMTKTNKTPNRDTGMGGKFMEEALNRKRVSKITIDIPGDGKFTVWNTKNALQGLADRAKRISTSTTAPKGFTESKPTREQGKLWAEEAKTEPPAQGPGLVDLGAATPGMFPETPSAFKHWWDVHFGKPAAKVLPTIKGLWQGRNVRADMATMRDWVDNAARLFGRANANDIRQPLRRQFGKDFAKADDALSFVVEAKGDPAALDEMRIKILDSKAADPWWRRKAYDALDFAIYNWDALNKLAAEYKGKTDAQVRIEQASGIDTLKREGYVPHRQDFSDEDFLFDVGHGDSTFFRKVRTYPTFADSIAAGVDPVRLASTDLLENRLNAGMRLVNSRKWLDTLRTITDPATKQPIAKNLIVRTRVDGSHYMEAPPGYVKESIGPHDVAIHKGYEGTFSALSDPSFFTQSMAGRAFMSANAAGKSVALMIDTFHLGRLAFWDSLIKGAGITTFKAPFPSYRRGVTLLDFSEGQIREMAASGEVPKKWLPELLESKRRLDLAVKSGYNVGRVSDALYQDLIHNLPVLGTFNKWLFDQFQRGAMAESWLLEFERAKRASLGYSEEALAKQVSKDLNTRFGNLGRQGLLKSKTGQDIARSLALAPQWNEGLIRSELGAVKQAGQAVKDAVTGKRIYTGVLLRSVGGMAVLQFVANQLINQATRGKFTWENPEEGWGAKLSAWIPDIAGNGPGFFLHPLGLAAETTHLLTNLYERSGGDTTKVAMDYARSRSSAALRPVLTLVTRTDFLGRRPKPGNLKWQVLRDAIPTPIAGAAGAALGKQLITGNPSEQFPGQFQKQAMSSVGIRTEGAPSPEQRITRLAAAWRREHNVPVNVEITGGSEYSGLIGAVRMGNTALAKSEMEKLQSNRTDKQILQYLKTWPKRAFTGSVAREREFRDGLSAEQEIAYLKARDERERIASEIRGMLR